MRRRSRQASRKLDSVKDGFTVRSVNMSEPKRILLSFKMMFGSPRGWFLLAFLAVVVFGGYVVVTYITAARPGGNTIDEQIAAADRLWNQDDNVEAVRTYKDLLNRRDPRDASRTAVLREDRLRMYRRIITHETIYGTPQDARDWITRAYIEGLNFEKADFDHAEVFELWAEVTEPLRENNGSKQRDFVDENRN